jgi:hypothetical protein
LPSGWCLRRSCILAVSLPTNVAFPPFYELLLCPLPGSSTSELRSSEKLHQSSHATILPPLRNSAGLTRSPFLRGASMRRIILMVRLVLLMASFVVVSALPAIAAPPRVVYECSILQGAFIFGGGAGEVPRRGETGSLQRLCSSKGGELTITVARDPDNRNPGKPDETPPCCAGKP